MAIEGLDSAGQQPLNIPGQQPAAPKPVKQAPPPQALNPPSTADNGGDSEPIREPQSVGQAPPPMPKEDNPSKLEITDLEEDGKATLNKLKAAGASQDQIDDYQNQGTQLLMKSGLDDKAIKQYWGVTDPNPAITRNFVKMNQAAYAKQKSEGPVDTSLKPVEAETFGDQIAAAWGMSVSGLLVHGKPVLTPRDKGFLDKATSAVTGWASDAPEMLLGGLAGAGVMAPIGGAAGTSVLPGVGTLGGIALGAGAGGAMGAFAAPAAMRKALMDHYDEGHDKDSFLTRLGAATIEGAKGSAMGLAMFTTGGAVGSAGPLVSKVMGKGIAGATTMAVAKASTELVTLAQATANLDGRFLPGQDDFINAGAALAGIHAVGSVLPGGSVNAKLRSIFAATGELPGDIIAKAQTDVILKQDLLSENPDLPVRPEAQPGTDDAPHAMDAHTELTKPEEETPNPDKPISAEPDPNAPAPLSADEQVIFNKIGEQKELPKQTLKENAVEFAQKMRKNWIDSYNYLKAIGADEAYKKATILASAGDKIDSFINKGTISFTTGDINGEALNTILQEHIVNEKDPNADRLKTYMMAKRGLELIRSGRNSMFATDAEMAAAHRIVAAGEARYQGTFDRIVAYQNRTLEYVFESGRFSEEQIDAIEEAGESYIPLNTIQNVDELTGKTNGGPKDIKRLKGSLEDKVDPILSIAKNTEMLVRMALVNDVRSTTVRNLEANGTLGEYLRVKEDGIGGGENTFSVYRDGVKTVYEGDPEVIDVMKRLDGNYEAQTALGKAMGYFAASLRAGSIGNPAFAVRHIWRSGKSAAIFSETGMIPFLHPMLSAIDVTLRGNRELYEQAGRDGALVNSFDRMNADYVRENIFKRDADGNEIKPSFLKKAFNYVNPVHLTEMAIQYTDNMNRYTEYTRRLDQGQSRLDAAYGGRNATIDYQRTGAVKSALLSKAAFANVHLQLNAKLFDGLTGNGPQAPESANALRNFYIKSFAGITLPAVMVWAATHDDERIKEAPTFAKNMYTLIPFPSWREAADPLEYTNMPDSMRRMDGDKMTIDDGQTMKIPVSGELDMIFGSMVTATLDSIAKKDPKFAEKALEQILETSIVHPIPTMAQPILEHYIGKNTFTGRRIVSASKERELPYQQYDEYTTRTAKALGAAIGYIPYVRDIGPKNTPLQSPMVIDNYIRDWTGGGGHLFTEYMTDPLLKSAGFAPDDKVETAKYWDQQPFVRDFVMHYPDGRAASIEEFHANAERAAMIKATYKDQARHEDANGADYTLAQYGDEMANLKPFESALKKQSAFIKQIDQDSSMSPTDKRQLKTTTYYQMLMISKQGNQVFNEFKKAMKDNNQAGAK